ncbi:hypothetical protein CIPAW_12G002300 [Carya illinoinensis]|uniref:Uncharacterized protein n=1 Tax=Carya illinoinensis TaxID=32201 RepID=A0A8T1NLB3_CARIL|nr:hypothetical protein CIPAW_12G002300 [Carya illinoinensis]
MALPSLQIVLKKGLASRQIENNNRNGNNLSFKLRPSVANILEKIVSNYHILYGGQLDEEVVLNMLKMWLLICRYWLVP